MPARPATFEGQMLRIAILAILTLAALPALATDAALFDAASRGDLAGVQRLLAGGQRIDPRNTAQETPLLVAVQNNHLSVTEVLIAAGADINAHARNMDTPWLLAGARGRTEMLERMLPKGPDLSIRNRFGGNALIPACERAHVETVRFLTSKTRIDVNHINNLGWTCLLEIVILGDGGPRHQESTRIVLAAGANPNIADREGISPLTHARRKGQEIIARMIADAGGK